MGARVRRRSPTTRWSHACAVAYVSDLGSGFGQVDVPGLPAGGPSIDHSLWFHEPIRADEWMLLELWPLMASSSRGVYSGSLRSEDGRLGVLLTQEMLLRKRQLEACDASSHRRVPRRHTGVATLPFLDLLKAWAHAGSRDSSQRANKERTMDAPAEQLSVSPVEATIDVVVLVAPSPSTVRDQFLRTVAELKSAGLFACIERARSIHRLAANATAR